jgi:hypothetical protein
MCHASWSKREKNMSNDLQEAMIRNLEPNNPAVRVVVESRIKSAGSSRLAHAIAHLLAKTGYTEVELITGKEEFMPEEKTMSQAMGGMLAQLPVQIIDMVAFDEEFLGGGLHRHKVTNKGPLMQETDFRVTTLFDAIKHGDEDHQTWLKAAIAAHFAGEPKPEYVAGKSSKDKPASDVEHHPV